VRISLTSRRLLRCAIGRLAFASALAACGCETPQATVAIENAYPSTGASPLIIYSAFWQAVAFQTPVVPGGSSGPQNTVPATANTAYVLLAPGWDPTNSTPPTAFIVLQSESGFAAQLDEALDIRVDDSTFIGNCGAGSYLTREQADFITQRVFQSTFAGLTYDPATCTTTGGPQ
jgi:hypothetical protein